MGGVHGGALWHRHGALPVRPAWRGSWQRCRHRQQGPPWDQPAVGVELKSDGTTGRPPRPPLAPGAATAAAAEASAAQPRVQPPARKPLVRLCTFRVGAALQLRRRLGPQCRRLGSHRVGIAAQLSNRPCPPASLAPAAALRGPRLEGHPMRGLQPPLQRRRQPSAACAAAEPGLGRRRRWRTLPCCFTAQASAAQG